MPPKRSQKSQKLLEQEGRILLAIKAIQNGQITTIAAAARSFEVPRSTLQARLHGRTNRSDTRANSHRLTEVEEESMKSWLISMDQRERGETPVQRVGKNWPANYLNRHPELTSRFSRKYDYKRALMEDPRVIREWFDLFQSTIVQHGILSDDIYNFDESGFAMGISATTKVVTQSVYTGRRGVLQPGNREWVTVVESIGASGQALPPYIIFKGKNFMLRWFNDLPKHWAINHSPNGWTSDEIGVDWLQKHFIPHTISRTKGKYRLLVLDGHNSHLTPQFDQICAQNDIIPICMPAHASHLLQPLDVGCFAVLKRSYGSRVAGYTRLGIDSIEKDDFIDIFPKARGDAFKETIIHSAFAATGLVPFDPDRVLSHLNIRLISPTLPDRPISQGSTSDSNISTGIPQSTKQLAKRKARLDSQLDGRLNKLSSPTKRDLEQYHKMTVKMLHTVVLQSEEIKRLRAANAKQVKKRAKSTKQLSYQGSLTSDTVADVRGGGGDQIYISNLPPAPSLPKEPPLPVLPPVRRQITCSGCNQKGHSFNKCPEA